MDWKILYQYWFATESITKAYIEERVNFWFMPPQGVDDFIKETFADWLGYLESPEIQNWKDSDQGHLSYIILADQIPRNAFRNSPRGFQYDPLALEAAADGFGRIDQGLSSFESSFYYLPFEHSEDREMQKVSVECFSRLNAEANDSILKTFTAQNLAYALQHQKVIERFGRFPHRNKILGRESTPEEIEFLKEPGSAF